MILDNQNSFERQSQNVFYGAESVPRAPSVAMAKKQLTSAAKKLPSEDRERVARMKLLRESLGFPQSAGFAAFLDVSAQRWNHVENGKPIGHELAVRLVRAVPGLTLDWIYFGKPDGLPLALALRLGEAGTLGKQATA